MVLNNSTYGNATLRWTSGLTAQSKITLYSLLLVWSLLGNVLVIAVVYFNKYLRTNMNYLIVNMAVSDLLVPLIALPWAISTQRLRSAEWLVEGPLGDVLCKLVPFLSNISPFVSSISLVVIAFQRFIAVVYPNRRRPLTRQTRWILIGFIWIVAMAPYSLYFGTYRLTIQSGYTMCIYHWSLPFDSTTTQLIVLSIVIVAGFVIPLITVLILYSIIHYKLRKSLNNVKAMIEKAAIRSRQQRNRRIFSMSITIFVTFTICWCPLSVFYLVWAFGKAPSKDILQKMVFTVQYLLLLLAAINPCIYFVFLKDFRKGLRILCSRKPASWSADISDVNINTRCIRTPGGGSNQDPTCTLPHINTTSV